MNLAINLGVPTMQLEDSKLFTPLESIWCWVGQFNSHYKIYLHKVKEKVKLCLGLTN
jgi:hypothetical protein